jgi:hypothetical protein
MRETFVYIRMVIGIFGVLSFISCSQTKAKVAFTGTWVDSHDTKYEVVTDGLRFRIQENDAGGFKSTTVFDGKFLHKAYDTWTPGNPVKVETVTTEPSEKELAKIKFWDFGVVEKYGAKNITNELVGSETICGRDCKKVEWQEYGFTLFDYVDKEHNVILKTENASPRICRNINFGTVDQALFNKPW